MTPGWYSARGIAVHWFEDFGHNSAKSLCGLIALSKGLHGSQGSFCMTCELQKRGLFLGRKPAIRAAV